jgi:hypothetical protein
MAVEPGLGCSDCDTARTNILWGGYRAQCESCNGRSLANSMAGYKARTAQTYVDLDQAIKRVYGLKWFPVGEQEQARWEIEQRETHKAGKEITWYWVQNIKRMPP